MFVAHAPDQTSPGGRRCEEKAPEDEYHTFTLEINVL